MLNDALSGKADLATRDEEQQRLVRLTVSGLHKMGKFYPFKGTVYRGIKRMKDYFVNPTGSAAKIKSGALSKYPVGHTGHGAKILTSTSKRAETSFAAKDGYNVALEISKTAPAPTSPSWLNSPKPNARCCSRPVSATCSCSTWWPSIVSCRGSWPCSVPTRTPRRRSAGLSSRRAAIQCNRVWWWDSQPGIAASTTTFPVVSVMRLAWSALISVVRVFACCMSEARWLVKF